MLLKEVLVQEYMRTRKHELILYHRWREARTVLPPCSSGAACVLPVGRRESETDREKERESLCDSWWIYARDQLSTECSSRSLWYTTHAHPVDTKTISERVEQWGAIRVRRVEHTIESEHSQLRNVTCESGKSMIEKMFARIANMRIWQVASDKVVGEYTCWLLHHDFQTN